MKEFIQKNKKWLIFLLLVLLLIGVGISVYFFFFKGEKKDEVSEGNTNVEQTATQEPVYDLRSSSEAILATYEVAKAWSSDAKLYDCSGLTLSSVEYPDITFYFLGASEGSYRDWNCTYYSKSKKQIKIYTYDQGNVEDDSEAMDIGEYGYLTYDSISYITNLESIVDSTVVYSTALENGLDLDNNYVNMYLRDTQDYGFVWKVSERSKTEKDDYGTGVLVNTYIMDVNNGSLKISTQEEVN